MQQVEKPEIGSLIDVVLTYLFKVIAHPPVDPFPHSPTPRQITSATTNNNNSCNQTNYVTTGEEGPSALCQEMMISSCAYPPSVDMPKSHPNPNNEQKIRLLKTRHILTEDCRTLIYQFAVEKFKIFDGLFLLLPSSILSLDLSFTTHISREGYTALATFLKTSTVATLNLSHTQIGENLNLLEEASSLTKVDLTANYNLTTKIVTKFLVAQKSLTDIELTECLQLDASIMRVLFEHPKMRIINLADLICDWDLENQEKEESFATSETIKSLCFRSCKITNSSLQIACKKTPKLAILDLSWCSNISDLPAALPVLPDLFALNLWSNSITPQQITDLVAQQKIVNLTSLTICDCKNLEETAVVSILAGCKKITSLSMWGCSNISPAAIQLIIQSLGPNLTHLSLAFCTKIDDFAIRNLRNCQKLKGIILDYCNLVTDKGLSELGSTEINTINFRRCPLLSEDAIRPVLQRSPNTSSLVLAELRLSDPFVREIPQLCPKLMSLDLSRVTVSGATWETLLSSKELAANCFSLKLDECNMHDTAIQIVMKMFRSLAFLSLSFNTNLTDAAFVNLGTNRMRSLTNLNIAGCGQFTNKTIENLSQSAPQMQNLVIAWNKTISPESLPFFLCFRRLTAINISYCSLIGTECVAALMKALRNLKKIDAGFVSLDGKKLASVVEQFRGVREIRFSLPDKDEARKEMLELWRHTAGENVKLEFTD